MTKSLAYLGLTILTMTCLPAGSRAQEDPERLLYSFEVTTEGNFLGYAGQGTEITPFVYQKDDFGSTSLALPVELARELDSYEQGPDSPIIKAIFVIRGSATVWNCGYNNSGDWECKKVAH